MNVHIREWDVEDAMVLWKLSMHPFYIRNKVWKYMYPDTFLHAVSTIYFYQNADIKKYIFRAITYNDEVCGYIECSKRTSSACELAYWLGVDYWNQGIMREAISDMCNEVLQKMDVLCIYARVSKKNIGSQKVLEYNGFTQTIYDDVYVYKKYR